MNHPTPGTDGALDDDGTDATGTGELLREAFSEAAYAFTPPPVPLAAIERDGRRRRRLRRATMLSSGCALLLAPLMVLAFRPDGPPESVQPMSPPVTAPSTTPSPTLTGPPAGKVRLVTPGERVTSEDGTEFWLTADGKHWRQPDPDTGALTLEEFRSVVDGNLDTTEPGISMQGGGGISDGYLVSGLFYGVRSAAARVEITTFDGTAVGGTVLRLKGNTSWGVWYGEVMVPEKLKHSLDFQDPVHKVTVYDTDDRVLAEMDFSM